MSNKPVFDVVRAMMKASNPQWVTFTPSDIAALDAAIAQAVCPPSPNPTKPSTTAASGFVLSEASKKQLKNVHPKLRECVELAIKHSLVDFRVLQGERTLAEQKKLYAQGATRTMRSKHLRQADGFAHAVDLAAMVGGKVTWDFNEYYYIARAMDRAATELGIADNVRWGAVWDRVLSDFGVDSQDKVAVRKAYLKAVEDYKVRHAGSDFLDGPHFEWVS